MPVEKQAYREAMARLGAAVNVITTDGPGGRAGFTASAVTSVTDTPPTLLVCANRANDSYPAMKENGVLCVNTLTPAQEADRVWCLCHGRLESGKASPKIPCWTHLDVRGIDLGELGVIVLVK